MPVGRKSVGNDIAHAAKRDATMWPRHASAGNLSAGMRVLIRD